MRAGGQLPGAAGAAARAGHRRRRRDAGRGRLHQRAVEGAGPRPVLPAVRDDLSGRPDDDRADRRARRADARLAGDVPDRRHPRTGHHGAAAAAAGVAALADRRRDGWRRRKRSSARSRRSAVDHEDTTITNDPRSSTNLRSDPDVPRSRVRARDDALDRAALRRSIARARSSSGRSGRARTSSPTA